MTSKYKNYDENALKNYSPPPEDTLDWDSPLFMSGIPASIGWSCYYLINRNWRHPLNPTTDTFTCVCGTETAYHPRREDRALPRSVTHCSNALCPMVHVFRPEHHSCVLEPRHFLQCRECGEVESQEGYYLREMNLLSSLRANKWIPDREEWSDQLDTDSRDIDGYVYEVPSTKPDNLGSVDCLETICMKCWLESFDVDIDQLRHDAHEREASDKLPYHHEEREARKRNRRRKMGRLSICPAGYLLGILTFIADFFVGAQQTTFTSVFPLSEFLMLPMSAVTISVLNLLAVGMMLIGGFYWAIFLFTWMAKSPSNA